ncbi:unnamed protein product [Alopecurus aequalis]
MARIMNNTRALCFLALVGVSITFLSCHAAGMDIARTSGWPKLCIAAEGCAPPIGPNGDIVCKAYCASRGYDKDKSECLPGNSSICCCKK